jgi:hypothetical protein
MNGQAQEEMELDNSQIGWEYSNGFLPEPEEPDSSPIQEPS